LERNEHHALGEAGNRKPSGNEDEHSSHRVGPAA
jgi:hypothetical protein